MATSGFRIEEAIRFGVSGISPRNHLDYLMLPIALVIEIDQLVNEGTLSQRKIASRLGVSRGIVSAIANGRRGLYGKDSLDEYSPLAPTSAPSRCPICGYRVYMPCLVCRTREHQHRQIILGLLARSKRIDNTARRKSAG
jgi:predicted XRE-type DNA-binding protein